jgi:ADP-L-glycero-D-manno-heptose 6-epimerase
MIYASSAATYGGGELGYKDDHDIVEKLQPLNPYGNLKMNLISGMKSQESSRSRESAPPFWTGLKFFQCVWSE